MEEKTILVPPSLTSEKPLYVFLKELKEHTLIKIKPKYDLILEFINKSFKLEIKTLIHFTKYNLSNLDMDNFEKVLEDYKYKLEGELSIDIDDIHIDVVKILSDCLSSINYSVHSHREKTDKKKIFLTIIDEPKKETNSENKIITPREIKKYEKENNKIKKDKKKQILNFINDFLDKDAKISSLSKFNNINILDISEEKQNNVIIKHKEILETNFDIEIELDDSIESILKKCIKNIGYELKKNKTKNQILLSIKEIN